MCWGKVNNATNKQATTKHLEETVSFRRNKFLSRKDGDFILFTIYFGCLSIDRKAVVNHSVDVIKTLRIVSLSKYSFAFLFSQPLWNRAHAIFVPVPEAWKKNYFKKFINARQLKHISIYDTLKIKRCLCIYGGINVCLESHILKRKYFEGIIPVKIFF